MQPGTPCTWFQLAVERQSQAGLMGDCAFQVLAEDEHQAQIGFTFAGLTRNKDMPLKQSGACWATCLASWAYIASLQLVTLRILFFPVARAGWDETRSTPGREYLVQGRLGE